MLDGRTFDSVQCTMQKILRDLNEAMAPDEHEIYTVRVNAKTVTRIRVPFAGYPGPLRLALPHPGRPGQRHDAPRRDCEVRF